MDLNGKLLTVGIVLVFVAPILGLFIYRWWRGETRFYGFWVTPREFKEERGKEERGDWPPPGP